MASKAEVVQTARVGVEAGFAHVLEQRGDAGPGPSTMAWSASTNASPKRSATRFPMEVLPAPVGPTRIRLGAGFMMGRC